MDNAIGDIQITDVLKHKYNYLYNSVPTSDAEMQSLYSIVNNGTNRHQLQDIYVTSDIIAQCILLLLVSSSCLTGSWSVWSHAVTPHSTIYHLVFVI